MNAQFVCSIQEHDFSQILGFCLHPECKEIPSLCWKCFLSPAHNLYSGNCHEFRNIISIIERDNQLITKIIEKCSKLHNIWRTQLILIHKQLNYKKNLKPKLRQIDQKIYSLQIISKETLNNQKRILDLLYSGKAESIIVDLEKITQIYYRKINFYPTQSDKLEIILKVQNLKSLNMNQKQVQKKFLLKLVSQFRSLIRKILNYKRLESGIKLLFFIIELQSLTPQT